MNKAQRREQRKDRFKYLSDANILSTIAFFGPDDPDLGLDIVDRPTRLPSGELPNGVYYLLGTDRHHATKVGWLEYINYNGTWFGGCIHTPMPTDFMIVPDPGISMMKSLRQIHAHHPKMLGKDGKFVVWYWSWFHDIRKIGRDSKMYQIKFMKQQATEDKKKAKRIKVC